MFSALWVQLVVFSKSSSHHLLDWFSRKKPELCPTHPNHGTTEGISEELGFVYRISWAGFIPVLLEKVPAALSDIPWVLSLVHLFWYPGKSCAQVWAGCFGFPLFVFRLFPWLWFIFRPGFGLVLELTWLCCGVFWFWVKWGTQPGFSGILFQDIT